jgi:hypothetical protein
MTTSHRDRDIKSTDTASPDVRPSPYRATVSDSKPTRASSKEAITTGTERTIYIHPGQRASVVIHRDTRHEAQRRETLERNIKILEFHKRVT